MRRALGRFALAGFVLFLSPLAQADYQDELLRHDSEALAFVHTDGFVMADVDALTDERYYSSTHFAALADGKASIRWPDADLDALTRAVLLLDAQEVGLPHVRYLLQYSINVSPDYPEIRHDYVEITRFNLGPERRRDVLQYVDEDHVAGLSEFGQGPHVSWRFALAPVMGMRAGLLYASRKEVQDRQAQALNCLGQPCLSLFDAQGPDGAWTPLVSPGLDAVPYHDQSPLGSTRAARIVQELWGALSFQGMDPLPYTPGQPQFIFVASVDVVGQDASAFGLVQQTLVMDHTVQAVWTRRDEAPDLHVRFTQAFVPRR